MKRMNVREFRKNVSALTQEPIEVVRYSETIGFWVPQGLTTEPRKRVTKKLSDEELKTLIEMIKKKVPMTGGTIKGRTVR